MKVLCVCDNLLPPSVITSGTKAVFNLYKELRQHGVETEFLTSVDRWTSPAWKHWVQNQQDTKGIHFHVIVPPFMKMEKLSFLWVRLAYFFHMLRLVRRTNYALVHDYSSSPLVANRTGCLRWFSKTYTFHTLCTLNTSFWKSSRWLLLRPHRLYTTLGNKKRGCLELALPIEERYFSQPSEEPTTPTFLYLGLLNQAKGIQIFLDAIPKVLQQSLDARCLIVTAPMRKESFKGTLYRSQIRRLITDFPGRIEFLEEVVDLVKLLKRVSVVSYPLTTLHGTLGNPSILLEAMASAKAIVVSQLSELDTLLIPGKNCLSFAPGDSTELARNMLTLLGNASLRTKLGNEARRSAIPFRMNEVASLLRKEYLKVHSSQL